ncbi:TPA: hypothetical protein QCU36_002592 [Bacillus cereus]|nr:hypothetical protein [Bacillus cereus]
MIIKKEFVERDWMVDEDTEFEGMTTKSIIVDNNVKFIMRGIVSGNLFISKGAEVEIHGIVKGDVGNEGGNLKVYGTINGSLILEKGNCFIDKKASVNEVIDAEKELKELEEYMKK